MKKINLIILIVFILLSTKNVYGKDCTNLIINNENTNIAIIERFNGDYLLPLRETITNLGGIVSYNHEEARTSFEFRDKRISYLIKDKEITYSIDGSAKRFNNHFDIEIKDDKAYITLSFLCKFIGIDYEMIDDNLHINSNEKLSRNFTIKPLLISHGGGEINNQSITNSLEAINNSYDNGARLIELDFLKTIDNKYVLGHDWGNAGKIFEKNLAIKTYENYIKKDQDTLTPIGIEQLIDILEENEDLYIVTDTKDDNKELLEYIYYNHNQYMERFKPQIYSIDEYYFAKELGFKDIIYSLYKVYLTDWQVFSFAKENELYAVTMAESRVMSGLAKRIGSIGIMTYVHTNNDIDLIEKYNKLGVQGFYTDRLY